MTPDSTGEPRPAGGRTMTPRAAFWRALCIWVLTLAVTATSLIYNHVHPLPPSLSGGAGKRGERRGRGGFHRGLRHGGCAARVETPGEPDRLAPVRHRPVVRGRYRRAAAAAIPRDPGLGPLAGLDMAFRHRVRGVCPAAVPDRVAAVAPLATGGVGGQLPPWRHGCSATLSLPRSLDGPPPAHNPIGVAGPAGHVFTGRWAERVAVLIAATGLAAIVSLVFRYRRARTVEREQLKWLVYAGGIIVVGRWPRCRSRRSSAQAARPTTCRTHHSGSIALVPIAIGIAIFRYHLYDIDVVINKTLVYGSLAVFITGVYVAIVVGIGSLAQRGARPSLALSIAATAVVAIAFQPVRAWVQHIANRLVYGQRATPYEILADFAGRMAGAYAAEDLLPRMARILAEGTGATRADVWLKSGDDLPRRRRLACRRTAAAAGPGHRGRRTGVPGRRPDPAGALPGRGPGGAVGVEAAGGIADADRGPAARRPRRPGRPGAQERRAAGAAAGPAGGDQGLAAAPGGGAGRGTAPDRAQHPRRRPAAAGGPGHQAQHHRIHDRHGHRRRAGAARRAAPGRGRRGGGSPGPGPRHLPAAAGQRGPGRRAARRRPGRRRCRPR